MQSSDLPNFEEISKTQKWQAIVFPREIELQDISQGELWAM